MIMLSLSAPHSTQRHVLGFFSAMELAVRASQTLRDENFCLPSGVSIHTLHIHLTPVHLDGILQTPWSLWEDPPAAAGIPCSGPTAPEKRRC